MTFSFLEARLTKRYPLRISRGVSTGSNNLFVTVSDGAHTGIGECAPGTGYDDSMAAAIRPKLETFIAEWHGAISIREAYAKAREVDMDPPAIAGLDMALWDLLAKLCNVPLYRLYGLAKPKVPTSVTIGINPAEVIRERVPEILARTGGKALKVKLGCPEGIERDKENYLAAKDSSSPFGVKLRVDANGGWTVEEAKHMMRWLAERQCDYVEQPLPQGLERELPQLFEGRPLPIFVDESVHFSQDVPLVAPWVDGVNLKLMKCGGLTEALNIVAVARAHGLQTMIGCMGESSVAISAGASIGALFDHIDLDSHLNLDPDPAIGALMVDGIVTPPERPGHGAELRKGA